jgi:hypothetical protein
MKPGYKTTEFYVALAPIVGSFLAALLGELPDKYAALSSAISAVGYAFARGFTKAGKS